MRINHIQTHGDNMVKKNKAGKPGRYENALSWGHCKSLDLMEHSTWEVAGHRARQGRTYQNIKGIWSPLGRLDLILCMMDRLWKERPDHTVLWQWVWPRPKRRKEQKRGTLWFCMKLKPPIFTANSPPSLKDPKKKNKSSTAEKIQLLWPMCRIL